ncbi:MAG: hypothetical protein ACUVQ3_05775 [bacterium]
MTVFLLLFFVFNYVYEDADSLLIINDSLVMCGYHQYNRKVHLVNNAKLKIRQWTGTDSTGKIILQAPLIHIHNSSIILGDGIGYTGGTNTHPDGYGPGYGHAAVGGGGGGAGYGGMGGAGGDADPGAGGISYGNPVDTVIDMGSGGGAGRLGLVDGFGGNGGALIYLRGYKIIIDSSSIFANGSRGNDGGYEAGGGGSGGGIKLWADTISLRYASVLAKGGTGGDASGGGGGGAGGGRIKIFSTTIDTNNLNLSVQGGNGGIGGYGNGEDGNSGSIYFGTLLQLEEIRSPVTIDIHRPSMITRRILIIDCKRDREFLLLYDVSGKIVKREILHSGKEAIDISLLPGGIYFLKIPGFGTSVKIILLK